MATLSSHPRKQRKALYNMPLHKREKLVTAPLSEELRRKYGVKRLPVRKGDEVKIMRGAYAGMEGKVNRVDRKNIRLYIDGVTREKADGTPVFIPIHPSKVQIIKLDLKDKKRKEMIERKTGKIVTEEEEKKEEKEEKKTEQKEEKEEPEESGEEPLEEENEVNE